MPDITKPYELTVDEKKIIKDNFKSHNDWDLPVFNTIKVNIRNYLRPIQNNRCCYCKRELGYDIGDVEIEHIIPKSKYEKFTFHTKNLALSCPGCNTKKSIKTVLYSSITNYPRSGTNFLLVQPHFDTYTNEIDVHYDFIYIPKSKKGVKTMDICDLYRFYVTETSGKKVVTNKDEISRIVEDIRNAPLSSVEQLIQALNNEIK